jgi:hypothetical protein
MSFETSPWGDNSAIDPALTQLLDKAYPPNSEIIANPYSADTGRPLRIIITSNCSVPLTFTPYDSSSVIISCDDGTDLTQCRITAFSGTFETQSSSPRSSLLVTLRHVENEFAKFINYKGDLLAVNPLDYVGVQLFTPSAYSNRFYPMLTTIPGTSMSNAIVAAQERLGISEFQSVKFIPNPDLRHTPITLAIKMIKT